MAPNEHYGIHLLAGGIGGTVGAILTCPLEVVKTRLQSSVATFQPIFLRPTAVPSINLVTSNCHHINFNTQADLHTRSRGTVVAENAIEAARNRSLGLYYCLRHILKNEGVAGLFKGLGPNLVGVAPSRAIYFFCYANSKRYLNGVITPDTPLVHIAAACTAGVTACTLTNPIWLVKTRLQLDQKKNSSFTTKQCIKDIYAVHGVKGFYKGLTASYVGVSETVIHFVLYEALKAHLLDTGQTRQEDERNLTDFLKFMVAGAISKTTATCVAYPHEVVRTRLREEGNKYHSFVQTLRSVYKEEGRRGLYRGLATQLVRQIPNTASMMATYELVVYLYVSWKKDDT